VPVNGGAPTVLASNQASPTAISVDATSVYWALGDRGAGMVMRAPLTGGAPTRATRPTHSAQHRRRRHEHLLDQYEEGKVEGPTRGDTPMVHRI
jgi:hypothetical protein